ncbi:Trafficking protein particle complex subunit 13 [Coemansia sp. RSA 2320]|nr:Trafficking protein particle complex subunit 13 [Coemansia sp. RSA 2320]
MASLLRETHPLTLKVMRLARPTLGGTRQLVVGPGGDSVLAAALREAEQRQPAQSGEVFSDMQTVQAGHPLAGFPVSEALGLPRAFGTMFLGETFAAHVCVCNEGAAGVRDVSVRVAMQTGSQQLALLTEAAAQLAGGQPLNAQVAHEIKELGAHVLACAVSYVTAQGERRVLQRAFKFGVANPLVVKTKVNHAARAVLLEVQVLNATQAPMALERLRFEPSPPFAAEDLGAEDHGAEVYGADDRGADGLGRASLAETRAAFMQPGDVRQFLYRLTPQPPPGPVTVDQERAAQYAPALGKLDILWRGAFGSFGRLQTSQLLRKSPGMFLIEIERAAVVGSEDNSACLELPFAARVRVRNVSDRPMVVSAAVRPHAHPAVIACGPAQHSLGEMQPGEAHDLDLQFLPLAPGVQRVGAVVLVDSLSGYTREVDHLLDVFVAA